MDTTYIEYELRKLRELVAELVADKVTPRIVVETIRKEELDLKERSTPPAPKFWKRYYCGEVQPGVADLAIWNNKEQPRALVYCFDRTKLIAAYTEIRRLEFTEGTISLAVDEYLKSNGGN